jgi:hypothetical protein
VPMVSRHAALKSRSAQREVLRRIPLLGDVRACRDATTGRMGMGLLQGCKGPAPQRRFLDGLCIGSRGSRLRAGPSGTRTTDSRRHRDFGPASGGLHRASTGPSLGRIPVTETVNRHSTSKPADQAERRDVILILQRGALRRFVVQLIIQSVVEDTFRCGVTPGRVE